MILNNMKQSGIILLFSAIFLSSCEKTWNCECQTAYDETTDTPVMNTYEISKATKREAKERCEGTYYDGPFKFEANNMCKLK